MSSAQDREQHIRHTLAQRAADLDDRVARAMETHAIGIMPGYFGQASSECREAYIAGYWYCCIMVAKAVAEGITRYVALRDNVTTGESVPHRVERLEKENLIPAEVAGAFKRIWGDKDERNDFMHMNPEVETEYQRLIQRARECVHDIYTVETHFFGYTHTGRAIRLHRPRYWDLDEDGNVKGGYLNLELQ